MLSRAIISAIFLMSLLSGQLAHAAGKAALGDLVSVEYYGTLEDGRVFNTNRGKEPVEFVIGSQTMLDDFEAAFLDMKSGDSKKISIPKSRAYGEFDPNKVIKFANDALPRTLKFGETIYYKENGQQIPMRVVQVDDKFTYTDANHFLAGRDLNFELKLISVIKTAEELASQKLKAQN